MTPSARGRSFADGALVIDKPAGSDVARHRRRRPARRGRQGRAHGHARSAGDRCLAVARRPRDAARAVSGGRAQGLRGGHAVRRGPPTTGDAARPAARTRGRCAVPGAERLAGALDRFRGHVRSAATGVLGQERVGGRRSYDLARAIGRWSSKPVPVTVHALDLIRLDGSVATLRVACSAGFYVRSPRARSRQTCLAAAHTSRRCGGWRAAASRWIRRSALERALTDRDAALAAVVPMADILPDLPAVRISNTTSHASGAAWICRSARRPDPMAARRGTVSACSRRMVR